MDMIYFDSAATARPFDCALTAAAEAYSVYGNPSSVHSAGIKAKAIIENSRKSIATALYCKPEEIIFTGGGSESNNQAIFGLAKLRARRSKRIITTDSEHPSVARPIEALEKDGFEIVRIATKGGELDIDSLQKELENGAAFVSIMLANNETGAKYDIAAVRRAIDRSGSGAIFHCDAVQGFLKTADIREIAKNCDLASISAHKVGGLKGVGALYCKGGIKLPAFILGGGQENGLRSGTENVGGIAAFGVACGEFTKHREHISSLYNKAVGLLSEESGLITLNIPKTHIDSILSVSVKGVRSEVMLNALNLHNICISAGSACSARKGPSGALSAYGLSKEEIEGTVRISFGAYNTVEEVCQLAEKLITTAKRLKR
ncbi:MAG: cysteine desulfurase [Ruminococcaceae bacterium]|nr:cysteine desulfurase [Oscillospiraceae bacterium]